MKWIWVTRQYVMRQRRYSLWVARVTAILALSLIAIVTARQYNRISLARDAAAQERDRAQQLAAFLVEVFSPDTRFDAQGSEPTAKARLDRGAQRIGNNTALQPEVRAQSLETLGLAYRRLGLSERAVPLLEQAVAIRREETPFDPHRTAAALANLAQALTDGGHLASVEAYLQQALQLSRSGDGSRSIETGDILNQFGQFDLQATSDAPAAARLFTQALAIYRGASSNQTRSIATTLANLAAAAVWMADYPLAERYQREVIDILQGIVSRNHPDRAAALDTLGFIMTERSKYAEAESLLNEALGIERTVLGEDNPCVAQVEFHLGMLYGAQGDPMRAIQATQMAVRIATDKLGVGHYLRGYYLDALANLYLKTNDLTAAERLARQALAVYAQSLPSRHLYVASTRLLLGDILAQRGLFAEAETELRAAVEIDAAIAGAASWRTARAQASLGWEFLLSGRTEEGEAMLATAHARLRVAAGAPRAATEWASDHFAEYLRNHHRDAEAAQALATADRR